MPGVTRQPRDRSAPIRGGEKAGLIHDVTWSFPGDLTPTIMTPSPNIIPPWMPYRTPITILKIAFSVRVATFTSFGSNYGPAFRVYERDRYNFVNNEVCSMKVTDDIIPGFDPFDLYQSVRVNVTSYQPMFILAVTMTEAYATDPDQVMMEGATFQMFYRYSNDFDLGA